MTIHLNFFVQIDIVPGIFWHHDVKRDQEANETEELQERRDVEHIDKSLIYTHLEDELPDISQAEV